MKRRTIKLVHGFSILYAEWFGLDRFGRITENPRAMVSYGVSLPLRLPKSFEGINAKLDALSYIGRYVAEKILFDGYTATKEN